MSTGFQYKDNLFDQAPQWQRTDEVEDELSSTARFHEFVVEGNDKALADFTKGSPKSAAWDEVFRNRLMERPVVSIENIPATSGPR